MRESPVSLVAAVSTHQLALSPSSGRWLRRRLHPELPAGQVPPRPAAPAHHQRRALHGRWHQDGRGAVPSHHAPKHRFLLRPTVRELRPSGDRREDHRPGVGAGPPDRPRQAGRRRCQDQVPCRRGFAATSPVTLLPNRDSASSRLARSPNASMQARRGGGGIILNAEGQRFCNELGRRGLIAERRSP